MRPYKVSVFTFGLGRRGRTRWNGEFKHKYVALAAAKLVSLWIDWFGGVHPELGIAWEVQRKDAA